MASDAKQQKSLLYVSSVLTNSVYVYSFPKGKLEGTLTGFNTPYGLCSDGAGNVWVVNDAANDIIEYAHGGTTPIATLSDPGEYPEGCSVDPTTGNLAVTNFFSSSGGGSVAVYAKAAGTPTLYTDPDIAEFRFCGYDDKGNLFADGATSASVFEFAELPIGKKALKTIPVQETVEWPGAVQYDGKYVAVGDTDTGKVYRIEGKSGKVMQTVTLGDATELNQFWIALGSKGKSNMAQSQLVGPLESGNAVNLYPYPSAKFSQKIVQVSEPFGAAVSSI
jgi:DNA-binding beta-propeller fold protein YncE